MRAVQFKSMQQSKIPIQLEIASKLCVPLASHKQWSRALVVFKVITFSCSVPCRCITHAYRCIQAFKVVSLSRCMPCRCNIHAYRYMHAFKVITIALRMCHKCIQMYARFQGDHVLTLKGLQM